MTSRSRKRLLPVVGAVGYLIFLLVLVETASWILLRWVGVSSPIGQAAAILDSSELEEVSGTDPARPVILRREALHPYLGFMPKVEEPRVPENVWMVWQRRFYGEDSPVFSSAPGDLVVGITGGSVAGQFARFGGAAALESRLSRMPRYAGCRVRFAAITFGGLKQPQQLMALNYILVLGGKLDLLINLDGFNEIALHESHNQAQGVAPIYPREWFHRTHAQDVSALIGELRYLRGRRLDLAQELLESPLEVSQTRRALWVLRDRSLQIREETARENLRSFDPINELDLPTSGPPTTATDQAGRQRELAAIWERSSLQLSQICATNGIDYFHFLQPSQYLPGSKALTQEEQVQAFSEGHPYGSLIPDGYPLLQEAGARLTQQGVRFHDLTQVFGKIDQTIYKDNCCHVNRLGNRLMGRAIAQAIASWVGDQTDESPCFAAR